jgi:trans-aconitate 2-methyltransferase
MTDWDPAQYLKFSEPRLQPAVDLLARIPLAAPERVYDLGCGTGNVTQLLRQRWPSATLTGIDSSAAMLSRATSDQSGIRWIQHDLQSWQSPLPADLIFSNAALHWLPHHEVLLPRLLMQLTLGGLLAIQMPRNFAAPSHTLIEDTVRSGPWRPQLEPLLRPVPVAAPDFYYRLLEPLTHSLALWETEYLQALQGPDPVKEWVKGTWLSPLLNALELAQRADFESDYAARLRHAYPALPSGVTLFPFRRLFIVAQAR